MRLALLLAALPLIAQTAPVAPAAMAHAAGCGANFSSPGWLGYCYLAIPVSASQGLYSWTMYQFIPNAGRVPSTVTSTGAALILRSFTFSRGTLDILGVGAIGAAVTGTATSFSPSGGGVAMWLSPARWTFMAGALEEKVGAVTKPAWIAGPGLTW
jgi:hypothetical protein